jgi:hypothetical protein
MTLEELLDELRTNLLRDNAQLASGPDDQLWSDDTLVRYLNDGQQRFARRTLVLRDSSTAEVCEVTLVAGVDTYALHSSVLAVISARYDTNTVDLARAGHTLFNVMVEHDYDQPYFDSSNAGTWPPGAPRAISTDEALNLDDEAAVLLRVWPAPSATEDGKIVHLRVARLPITPFALDTLDGKAELPEAYQLDMLEWAAYRALRTSDIDGHSDLAAQHEARFNTAVADALKDLRRKLRAPITFGFGRGGFTWSR